MSKRVHFIGIGGIGMSALAQILLAREVPVSGSDVQASDLTARLATLGAKITIGHKAESVTGAARVIISDAIRDDNVELKKAKQLGLPITKRSKLLAELMSPNRGIAISGTHGKTTVTAMIGLILVEAGLDPTVELGGEYVGLGGNARVGKGEWFVAEACEAYESFLDLQPEIAVITNIEPDHLDHHKTLAHLRGSFVEFLHRVPSGGTIVLCADRPELLSLPLPKGRRVIWYGESERAEVRGMEVAVRGWEGVCKLFVNGRAEGELRVGAPGTHNVINALGATAAALTAGASLKACQQALSDFNGVGRRGITSGLIADHVRALVGEDAVIEMAKQEMATKLQGSLRTGDVVLAMGAGDIGMFARELAQRLGGAAGASEQVAAKQ